MPFDNPQFETDEILKDLQHVKACVSRRWFQGSSTRDGRKGRYRAEPGDDDAHCLVTPIIGRNEARLFMANHLPKDFILCSQWNNEPGRTKAEVIAFLDGCIAARQQELAYAV